MSRPVQYLPHTLYLLTRRCLDGQCFFSPDHASVRLVVLYLLAYYAERYSLKLLGIALMSNHVHIVVWDTKGNLGDFKRDFFQTTSRANNTLRGRSGTTWEPGVGSHHLFLFDADIVADKLAYALANPVEAGLVERHDQWPGAISRADSCPREPQVFKRPDDVPFFGDRTVFPDEVTLTFVAPPDTTPKAFAADVAQRVADREAEAKRTRQADRADRRAKGEHISNSLPLDTTRGAKACKRVPWVHKPAQRQKRDRHRIRPMFAGPKAVVERLAARDRQFLSDYREAMDAFRAGQRDVVFPAGTFAMAYRYGANVAPAPG